MRAKTEGEKTQKLKEKLRIMTYRMRRYRWEVFTLRKPFMYFKLNTSHLYRRIRSVMMRNFSFNLCAFASSALARIDILLHFKRRKALADQLVHDLGIEARIARETAQFLDIFVVMVSGYSRR